MELVVFSRRWGHDDTYTIGKIEKGWNVQHASIGGECDKKGNPFLMKNLDHDSINYPESLGDYMEYLWDESTENDRDEKWIQEQLNQISEWIKAVEKTSPTNDFWKGYK